MDVTGIGVDSNLVYYRGSAMYSLRNGKLSCRDITSVVHNSSNSVPERLLRLHGRWKTNAAKDMHVKESLEKRLEVMRHLGL